MEKDNYEELRESCLRDGVSLFGVGKVEPVREAFHPSIADVAKGLDHGISFGFCLSEAVMETVEDRPTLIYKHHYRTVNWLLDRVAFKCAGLIQAKGFRALPIPASQLVDWKAQLGHLPHVLTAHQAGLGWIGKSNLLVNPVHGAMVRYATVLTDMPLSLDSPAEGNCGECRECINVCPAGAITETGYDRWKCFSKLKEFSRLKGIGVMICGLCVKVCKGGK